MYLFANVNHYLLIYKSLFDLLSVQVYGHVSRRFPARRRGFNLPGQVLEHFPARTMPWAGKVSPPQKNNHSYMLTPNTRWATGRTLFHRQYLIPAETTTCARPSRSSSDIFCVDAVPEKVAELTDPPSADNCNPSQRASRILYS